MIIGNVVSPFKKSSFGVAVNPVWDGITSYYTADDTPDDSLGTNNGTLVNGAHYAAGQINNGFEFDGINDYVSLPNDGFDLTGSWTIEGWVYPTGTGYRTIFSQKTNDPTWNGVDILWLESSAYLLIQLSNGGTFVGLTTPNNSVPKNAWSHLMATRVAGVGTEVFVNGASVASNTSTMDAGAIGVGKAFPAIGVQRYQAALFSQYWTGKIDELGIFDGTAKELSDAQDYYNGGAGRQYPK